MYLNPVAPCIERTNMSRSLDLASALHHILQMFSNCHWSFRNMSEMIMQSLVFKPVCSIGVSVFQCLACCRVLFLFGGYQAHSGKDAGVKGGPTGLTPS